MNKLLAWISDKTLGSIPAPTFPRTRRAYAQACSIRIPNWLNWKPLTAAASAVVLSLVSLITFGLSSAHASTAAPHKPAAVVVRSTPKASLITATQTSSSTPEQTTTAQVQEAVMIKHHRHWRWNGHPPLRIRAYRWAKHHIGCPYNWGGDGPCTTGWDCSGFVLNAYAAAGLNLWSYRTVADMVMSGHLIQVRRPRIGDLGVYGSGWGAYHVVMFAGGKHHWWIVAESDQGTNSAFHELGVTYNWPTAWFEVVRR